MGVNILAEVSAGLICDIVIAVIALIIIGSNVQKGFVKQIIGLVATIGAVLVAYFFCKDLVNLVNEKFGWHDKLAEKLLGIFGKKEAFNAALTEENVRAAVASIGLPDFVADACAKLMSGVGGAAENVGQFLSDVAAKYILLAASFIVLFIVARLVLGLVKGIIIKIVSLPIISGVDKLLALVLGVIKAVIVIYVGLYVIQMIPLNVSFLETVKSALNESKIIEFLNGSDVVKGLFDKISELIKSIKI